MTKKPDSAKNLRHLLITIVAVAIALGVRAQPAYCQADGAVLMLQVTPRQSGTVSPAEGVHRFELHSAVTLTATPKPGYQFLYWLGDVSDPTSSNTIVLLDAPKIIIAVFEQTEFELAAVEMVPQNSPVGGAFFTGVGLGRGGIAAGGARRPDEFRLSRPTPPEPPEPPDFPVPEPGDDFPVPVPEPATAVLFAGGILLMRIRSTVCGKRRRKR
jgi:hypothetical protein